MPIPQEILTRLEAEILSEDEIRGLRWRAQESGLEAGRAVAGRLPAECRAWLIPEGARRAKSFRYGLMSLGGVHNTSDKRSPRLVRCFCSDREPRRAADPLGFYLGRGIEVVAGPSLLFSVEWVGESGCGGEARAVCLEAVRGL